jgi:hypothetical protein
MMETDWSVAAGADDPVIEVPWSDAASGLAWVDLRVDAEAQSACMSALPEVAASPAMAKALRLLNAPHGLLMTTKCDRWQMSDEDLAELADVLDAPAAAWGIGSYIDVLMAHAVPMSDFLMHEEWARTTARRCAAIPIDDSRVELVIRPAHNDAVWGYGITMYCYAGGADEQHAEAAWSRAIEQAVPVLIATAESMVASLDEISGDKVPAKETDDA